MSVRFGSAKIEVGGSSDSLIDLGIANDVEFDETITYLTLAPYNAPEEQIGIKDHYVTLKFTLLETHLRNISLLRGGLDTLTYYNNSSVDVSLEAHTLTGTTPERLNFRNSNDQVVSNIRIITGIQAYATMDVVRYATTDGKVYCIPKATAVKDTDYTITVDSAGYTCIARVSGSAVIQSGSVIYISYTYTPAQRISLATGGKQAIIEPRTIRFVNTSLDGKKFYLTIFKATYQKGIIIKFPSDDSEDTHSIAVEMKGVFDITRLIGNQLFEYSDYQGV